MFSRLDSVAVHKAASFAAQRVPRRLAGYAVDAGAWGAALLAGDRRLIVERNLERATETAGQGSVSQAAIARSFATYGRYYLDSFRLPGLSAAEIDDGFRYTGYEHISTAIESGTSPILVLPHLGGWEWAAFWLTKVKGLSVTAVVEPLEPPELFDWFRSFRESLGMEVIGVGPSAGSEIAASLARGSIVCLLSDRVVADASAVPVTFFDERTLLPAGPAALALRTGAPLLPVAVYFDGDMHVAEVRPPVDTSRTGPFRDDVARVTQQVADEFERFIRAAPDQWHVLQPGWPSDFRALGRRVPERFEALGGGVSVGGAGSAGVVRRDGGVSAGSADK